MSLVNDMLKDLDRRQAPGQNPALTVDGYGSLTKARKRTLTLPFTFAVVFGVLVLVLALLWYFRGFFIDAANLGHTDLVATQTGTIERPAESSRKAGLIGERIGESVPVLALAAEKLDQKGKGSINPPLASEAKVLQATTMAPQISAMAPEAAPTAMAQPASTIIAAASQGKATQPDSTPPVTIKEKAQTKVSRDIDPVIVDTKKTVAKAAPAEIKPAVEKSVMAIPDVKQPPPEAKDNAATVSRVSKVIVKTPEQEDAFVVDEARQLLTNRGALAARAYLNEAIPKLEYHDGSSELLVLLMLQSGEGEQSMRLLQQFPVRSSLLDAQLRARVFYAQGDVDGAIEALKSVSVAVASAPEHHVMLAAFYQQAGLYADAVAEYASLVGVDDSVGNWWAGLGMALEGVGQLAAGQRAYGRAMQLSNLSPQLNVYIAKRLETLQTLNLK